MLDPAIPPKPLWRCVLRKSTNVTEKLVLWASYCICGIASLALAAYGALALYSISVEPIHAFVGFVCDAAAFGGSLLAMVPWYVYVGAAMVAAILAYSFLWCVSRELTDEDYNSDIAKFTSLVLGLGLALWLGLGLALWLGLGLALWLGLGLIGAKPFSFLGAYLHYRKRMKEAKQG